MIDAEAFEAWRENPVTRAVFDALTRQAQKAKAEWLSASWEGGNPDPLLLADLRATHRTSQDIVELTVEDLLAAIETEETKA